jgi:hypothetical protein
MRDNMLSSSVGGSGSLTSDSALPRTGRNADKRANLSAAKAIYAQILSRIAKAASLARIAKSPAGPTHEGQPPWQPQLAINSCVFASNSSLARNNGSENPIPPG